MKRQVSKTLKKTDTLEKEFKRLKTTVSEIQGYYSSGAGVSGDIQPQSGQVIVCCVSSIKIQYRYVHV